MSKRARAPYWGSGLLLSLQEEPGVLSVSKRQFFRLSVLDTGLYTFSAGVGSASTGLGSFGAPVLASRGECWMKLLDPLLDSLLGDTSLPLVRPLVAVRPVV